MPTIAQLVRDGRQDKVTKSKAPYLGIGLNTLKKKETSVNSPQKRGVCVRVTTMTPKNQTQRYVSMRVLDYLTVSKSTRTFQVKDIHYKNTASSLSVVVVLKTYQGLDTTSFVAH